MTLKNLLCLDIGGSHISAAIVERSTPSLVNNAFAVGKVDSHAAREAILQQWQDVIAKVQQQAMVPLDGILIAMPGPFDYENGISLMDGMHKYQSLLHVDIKAFFAETYKVSAEHIHFFNDAEAFLLGEVYAHRLQTKVVVGLTLGTGLGSALYREQHVKDLNYGSAAFRMGIAEDYISTRGILSFVNRRQDLALRGVKELVERADLHPQCQEAFAYLGRALQEFIQQYVLPLAPDVLVLGGNIAQSHALFLAALQQELPIQLIPASFDAQNLFFGLTSTINK